MENKNRNNSIIYINFAPYENTGNIRDYILHSYGTAAVFLFNFHRLTNLDQPSTLTVYRHSKNIYHTRLFQTPTVPAVAFILLPVRSAVIFGQIIFHTLRLRSRFGPFNDFFTVNAFIAWCGIILKKLHLVDRTIFWVWDYYPPTHTNKMIQLIRWMYWWFDRPATHNSDRVIFLNNRMVNIRKKLHVLIPGKEPLIVPIGTDVIHKTTGHDQFAFVFLGVLKRSQGLDLFFDSLPSLIKISKSFSLHIIGGGPDEIYFRLRAKSSPIPIYFHGYESDETKVNTMLSQYGIGVATYHPDRSNVSYWGEPSKIKRYISSGIPVITTDVFEFSKNIRLSKCGEVIPYEPAEFIKAVKEILRRYNSYRTSALREAAKYQYQHVYTRLFV